MIPIDSKGNHVCPTHGIIEVTTWSTTTSCWQCTLEVRKVRLAALALAKKKKLNDNP